MAMLIQKFHTLIQSKVLWTAMLIMVVIAFVGLYIRWPGSTRREMEASSPGKLGGEYVPQQEFRRAYFNTYLSLALMVGGNINANRLDKELREASWRRLAALRAARKAGFAASDGEVLGAIQHHPGFMVDGRFSQVRYNTFVSSMLAGLGVTEGHFEDHVREEVALQKMRHMITQGVLISPYEVERAFHTLMDTFTLEYVRIGLDDVRGDVKVSAEDAQAFFEKDPEMFELPAMVRVKYVSFPVADHLEGVTVTEEDAQTYYDDQIDEFTQAIVTTNYVTNVVIDAMTGKPTDEVQEETAESEETTPFEDVKDELIARLTKQEARNKATDLATDFVVMLAPDRDNTASSFEDAAAKFNLEIKTLAPFAATQEVAEVDAGLIFNRAAFALSTNPEEYFSDAVPGTNFVYVIALEERIAARIPEFEEVEDEVRKAAEAAAAEQALTDKAQALREAAIKDLAEGKTFARAAKSFGFKVKEIEEMSAASQPEDLEDAPLLLRGVLVRNEGEVTDLLPAEEAVYVAHIVKRAPGDPATLASLRPQIVQTLRRDRSRLMFEEWQEYLLRKGDLEERERPELLPEDEEPLEDEEFLEEEEYPVEDVQGEDLPEEVE